jgi:hypothetical protein
MLFVSKALALFLVTAEPVVDLWASASSHTATTSGFICLNCSYTELRMLICMILSDLYSNHTWALPLSWTGTLWMILSNFISPLGRSRMLVLRQWSSLGRDTLVGKYLLMKISSCNNAFRGEGESLPNTRSFELAGAIIRKTGSLVVWALFPGSRKSSKFQQILDDDAGKPVALRGFSSVGFGDDSSCVC